MESNMNAARKTSINLITSIFEKVDILNVNNRYTKALIDSKDEHFANFLSNYLDDKNINEWLKNPNNVEILEEVADAGYNFYNYYYIGYIQYRFISNYIWNII